MTALNHRSASKTRVLDMRTSLMIMVLLCLLPSLAIIWNDGRLLRQQAAETARTQAVQIAQQAVNSQQELIETGRQFLVALSHLTAVQSLDAEACNPLFSQLLPKQFYFATIFATTPAGDVFCSSMPVGPSLNFSDREYFQHVLQSHQFAVSEYIVGRVTEKPVIALAYPVLNEHGSVKAVLVTSLDLTWINQINSKTPLLPGSVVEVIDSSGVILNRYPGPQDWVGKTLSGSEYFEAVRQSGGEGSFEMPGPDGVERLYAAKHLYNEERITAHVVVGIPSEIAYAGATRIQRQNLLLMAGATGLALAAAWVVGNAIIIKNIHQLIQATMRLAESERRVKTDVRPVSREFIQLGEAFDQMAEQIERQRNELRLAEAKYRTLVEQMPAGTYLVSMVGDGKLIYLSPQIETLAGAPLDDWYDNVDLWTSLIHPADLPKVERVYNTDRPGERKTLEYRIVRPDGTIRWVSDVSSIIPDEEGQPNLLQGMVTDITQRKQAERELESTFARLKFFVDSNMIGVTIGDTEGRVVEANDYYLALLDLTREDLEAGRVNWKERTPPEHIPINDRAIEETLRHGKCMPFEKEIIRKNGTRVWLAIANAMLPNSNLMVSYVLDITARKHTESVLSRRMKELACLQAVSAACVEAKNEDDLLESVTQIIGDHLFSNHFGVLMCNEAHTELYVHPSYRTNGLDGNIVIPIGTGVTGRIVVDGQPRRIGDISLEPSYIHSIKDIRSELCAPIKIGGRVVGVINAESDQYNAFSESDERMVVALADQLALGLERLHFESDLEKLATIDALSGVLNRRSFMEQAENEVNRALRFEHPISAIMLDIDLFKVINDTRGHASGDQIIREVTKRFRSKIRDIDLIGRVGGDEFAILLLETDLDGAQVMAERIRSEVAARPFQAGDEILNITVSLGVAQIGSAANTTIRCLLACADQALYDAKHNGRNQVAVRRMQEMPVMVSECSVIVSAEN